MLATVRLLIFLFITTLLFSCATTQMSPEQVLQIQEREEKIIKKHFGRKLGPFEGIWLVVIESITRPISRTPIFETPPIKQTIAIYKRGDAYIAQDVLTGKFLYRLTKEMKKSELEYVGTCTIFLPLGNEVGNFTFLSVDDDSLHDTCKKKRLLGDFYKAVTYTRIYPKDLKEHNSQY